jgi:hypothetical protein
MVEEMDKPIGYYPIEKDGEPVAVVHIYAGREYECHQRALYLSQALARYEKDTCTDQTGGPLEYTGPSDSQSNDVRPSRPFDPNVLRDLT